MAWEGDTLVFVEVKTRVSGKWSAPERDIDAEKINALRRAARDYVRRSGADESRVRFDAIAITGDRLEHLRDAFVFALCRPPGIVVFHTCPNCEKTR